MTRVSADEGQMAFVPSVIPVATTGEMPEAVVEVSVVMPCLNEASTVAACIGKAQDTLRSAGIAGEVIVLASFFASILGLRRR